MNGEITWHDLKLMAADTPTQIRLDLLVATTHQQFHRLVEQAVDWISQEFTKTRQNRQKRSEDDLSIDFVTILKSIGMQASHDTKYGGHCDIVIEARGDFLWLGEAKLHRSYPWLLKGLKQLDTRYATALPKQDTGGMIIYCYQPDAAKILDTWAAHLKSECPDVTVDARPLDKLEFQSHHTNKGSGLPFHVRHTAVVLHFAPQDRTPGKS